MLSMCLVRRMKGHSVDEYVCIRVFGRVDLCSLTGRTAKNARGILFVSQLVRRYNLLVTRTCMCLLRISKHWMIRLRSLRLHLLSVYTAFAVQPQTCSVSSFEHAGEVVAGATLQREARWCVSNRGIFYQQPSTFTGETRSI